MRFYIFTEKIFNMDVLSLVAFYIVDKFVIILILCYYQIFSLNFCSYHILAKTVRESLVGSNIESIVTSSSCGVGDG